MKKNILATTLLSVLAINTMSMTIYAEEMSDSATSTAKITFEGNDTHSNKPVNPDNPDKLIIKKDNTSKANKTEEIDIGTVTATTTFML